MLQAYLLAMKRAFFLLVCLSFCFSSCEKGEESPALSGIVSIDNTRTYIDGTAGFTTQGFSFSLGEKVATGNAASPPDISVSHSGDDLFLQTNSYNNSFYLYGSYGDAESAQEAFATLASANITTWEEWANPVTANQIWIFRTSHNTYAKFRIVSTLVELRQGWDYTSAECTLEWEYQPDGSLTFPIDE